MHERNLDFEIPMTRDQWHEIGRSARALEPSGFTWTESDPDRIHVLMRDEEARGLWSRFVSDDDVYGAHERELAEFVFNDGRPYAHLKAPPAADEPSVTDEEEHSMAVGQEDWVRRKWDYLMEQSGIHFERGHIPGDVW
ncbi:MAG TPA: hypothetical protein VFL93_10335 [Longimicrobiaceae bacterium]|jgi:hypothetical protein|nr:hypothetical protein [Longimicrobiaceae bacterium]